MMCIGEEKGMEEKVGEVLRTKPLFLRLCLLMMKVIHNG
jgi:hypothetical protein